MAIIRYSIPELRTQVEACDECSSWADLCFTHKMRYWATEGAPVRVPEAFDAHGMTVREKQAEIYEGARVNGVEIERAS